MELRSPPFSWDRRCRREEGRGNNQEDRGENGLKTRFNKDRRWAQLLLVMQTVSLMNWRKYGCRFEGCGWNRLFYLLVFQVLADINIPLGFMTGCHIFNHRTSTPPLIPPAIVLRFRKMVGRIAAASHIALLHVIVFTGRSELLGEGKTQNLHGCVGEDSWLH